MTNIKTEKAFTPQIESGIEVSLCRIRKVTNPDHLAIIQTAKVLRQGQSFFVPVEVAPRNFLVNIANAMNKESNTTHCTVRTVKDSFGIVTGFRFHKQL